MVECNISIYFIALLQWDKDSLVAFLSPKESEKPFSTAHNSLAHGIVEASPRDHIDERRGLWSYL